MSKSVPRFVKRRQAYADEHRSAPTRAERLLAAELPSRFEREVVVFKWIVDFYDRSTKTIIEVDGPYHDQPDIQARDRAKDSFLRSRGLTVLRVTNKEVEADPVAVALRLAGTYFVADDPPAVLPPMSESTADRRLARSLR